MARRSYDVQEKLALICISTNKSYWTSQDHCYGFLELHVEHQGCKLEERMQESLSKCQLNPGKESF